MRLLFIDHEFHRKTRSAEFFVAILRNQFEVAEHYYARYYRVEADGAMRDRDCAIIWEFPISRRRFYFAGKRNVFVPMYDNEWGSFWQWKRIAWSGMGVISFCDKVSEHARQCGVKNILDVRYFPDPTTLPQKVGDPKKVFLWERGFVTREVVEKMFPPFKGYTCEVKGADDFLPREEYLDKLASCGIVIAPRRKEGIGMAFLEAMAMGKCVVAYNDATMNEYIKDGETGILFEEDGIEAIDESKTAVVRRKLLSDVSYLRSRWMADALKINSFIAAQAPCRPSLVNRLKIMMAYPLYLVEGLVWRVRYG